MALEMKGMTDCGIRVTFTMEDKSWRSLALGYRTEFTGHGFHVVSRYRSPPGVRGGDAVARMRADIAALEAAGIVPATVRVKFTGDEWGFHPGLLP